MDYKSHKKACDTIIPFQFDTLPIRGFICKCDSTLTRINEQHKYPLPISKLLAEASVLTIMMANSVRLQHKLSLQIQGKGGVNLIATDYVVSRSRVAIPSIRGYARYKKSAVQKNQSFRDLIGNGYFATHLDQGDGNLPYRSISDIRQSSLTSSAEEFFNNSEQLFTKFWIKIGTKFNSHTKTGLKGFGLMLQRLPEEKKHLKSAPIHERKISEKNSETNNNENILTSQQWDDTMSVLNEIIKTEPDFLEQSYPYLLSKIFANYDIRIFDSRPFEFGCSCGPEKVIQAMSIYSSRDLESMTNAEGKVTADCQFCGAFYQFDPSELGQKDS